jgi:methionyl-tRNA formyltransferase
MERVQGRDLGDAAQVKPFNVLFITQEDPFYVRIFFEEFLRNYPRPEEIKAVVIAPTMGKRSLIKLVRQMYKFYGAVDFVRMGSRFLYYKTMNFLGQFKLLRRYYSIRQVCEHYRVPVIAAKNINDEAFVKSLQQFDLDLIVSVAAPQIFKERLLGLPRKGCINIHNAKLPKYRGMLPNFWQMYHGEKVVGTTIHRLNSKLDDGEILLQRETPILRGESLEALIVRTKRFGASLMIEAIQAISEDLLQPLPNDSKQATYFSFPTRRDVSEFKKRGYKLL